MSTVQKGKSASELQEAENRRQMEAKKSIHDAKVRETKQELRDSLQANDDTRLLKACSSFFGLHQKHLGRSKVSIPATSV